MPNVDGGSLWELVEQRAAATPDALAAVDEDGRTLTWAESKTEAERAAAGLARHGIGARDVVSWQLPTWLESKILVLALARLGAIQNPMLPIYRDREVRFITQQTKARLIVTPSEWRGFDYEAMCREAAAALPGLEVLVCDKSLPEGDPATLPESIGASPKLFPSHVYTPKNTTRVDAFTVRSSAPQPSALTKSFAR